jgi:hypothetical protein
MVLHKRGMKVDTNVWDVNKQNIVNWDVARERSNLELKIN